MKVYTYRGVEYSSARQVRQAIFETERKAFAVCKTAEEWLQHGVVYTETEDQLTQEQLAQRARAMRDYLLTACDYYVMPDYPATEEGLVKVKAYRQALRDITRQDGFPSEIEWPVIPDVIA